MNTREAVERARARAKDDTRPVRGDEPPAIGSGTLGTLDCGNGKRSIPPYGWHHRARGLCVCGGEPCPAYEPVSRFRGICLVDPTDEGEEDRSEHIPGRTLCPLGMQGLFEQLQEALAWVNYLGARR